MMKLKIQIKNELAEKKKEFGYLNKVFKLFSLLFFFCLTTCILLFVYFIFIYIFYAPEGTSGGILKSNRPSVRPSVTNRVSAISHKLLKQI